MRPHVLRGSIGHAAEEVDHVCHNVQDRVQIVLCVHVLVVLNWLKPCHVGASEMAEDFVMVRQHGRSDGAAQQTHDVAMIVRDVDEGERAHGGREGQPGRPVAGHRVDLTLEFERFWKFRGNLRNLGDKVL